MIENINEYTFIFIGCKTFKTIIHISYNVPIDIAQH